MGMGLLHPPSGLEELFHDGLLGSHVVPPPRASFSILSSSLILSSFWAPAPTGTGCSQ